VLGVQYSRNLALNYIPEF